MWSTNGVWNLLLLVLGVFLAGVVRVSYRGGDVLISSLTEKEILADAGSGSDTFGTASVDEASLSYIDENGVKSIYLGAEEITDFCIDILGN